MFKNVWENAEVYHPVSIKKHRQKDRKTRNYRKTLRTYKRRLQKNATEPEKYFKLCLEQLDIKHDFQRIFIIDGSGYIVDFYLNDYLMVIELDGGHHYKPAENINDYIRTELLLKLGLIKHVLRFDNDEVLNMSLADVSRALTLKICPFAEQYEL